MTVTFPSSGAPRSRGVRRLGARLAGIVAVAALLVGPWTSASARAADATPTPSPSPTLSGSVSAVLAPVDSGVVRTGEPLNVWVALENGTAFSLGTTSVVLSLGTTAIADRSALGSWLAGSAGIGAMTQIGTASLDAVPSGADSERQIYVSADDPALTARSPGVYPLKATFRGASGTWTATSTMVIPDPDAATTPVGLVVPITAGPLTTGLLTADELTALTGPDGQLTAQLDAVTGTTAILAIDPAIPAAIRVLGTAAPATATQWLDALMALPNERFALQFGDADTALQTQTDHSSLITPLSLQSYMSANDFLSGTGDRDETAGPEPTPTATADPDQPVYPDMDALLNIGSDARSAVYWPFSGTAGPDDVAALGKLSADDESPLTLIPSTSTAAGAKGGAVTAPGTSGSAGVLVYDAAASSALRAASVEEEAPLRGAPLATATAYLTLAAHSAHGSPLLVVADRATDRAALGLDGVVNSISRLPRTTSASLTQLADANPSAVTVTAATADPERVIALGALQNDERRLTSFSTVLDDPNVLNGPQRAEILQLIGGGWLGDDTAWSSAVTTHERASATTLSSVSIAPTSSVNLVGSAAPLRFWVRNDLPWRVNVVLLAQPNDLRLEVQQSTKVVAQPSSNTRVEVPVQAKVGNGDVMLTLQLRSPALVAIGTPQTVDINVRADWEALGLTVLGILVGGFLVLGLIRTIQARRRRARDAAVHPSVDEDADPETGEGSGAPPEPADAVGERKPE